MSFRDQIRPQIVVKNVHGEGIGKVDHVDGDRIKLTAHDSTDDRHHYIPLSDVSRVKPELDAVAATLKQYGATRIRINGLPTHAAASLPTPRSARRVPTPSRPRWSHRASTQDASKPRAGARICRAIPTKPPAAAPKIAGPNWS